MENLLKIGGLLAVLVVPIILAFLNNRLAHLKHSKESKVEALKLADEFESSELEKRSILYKDRLAKSLFNNDDLTYSEAKFFIKYENADIWVREYVKVRENLKRERNQDGEVTGFKRKSHWIKFGLALVGYGICAFIGLIPFVIMNKYIALMVSAYEKGMPLMIALQLAIPIILLFIAYLCLRLCEKHVSCGIFLHDFYKVAFKIKGTEEKNDSEIDAAA
jgi:hypothetical protein